MELYEALKSGTSADDLETAFRAELAAAQERLDQEQQELENREAETAYLEDCRSELAEALYDYVVALIGEDSDITIDEIEDKLLEIEKEVMSLYKVSKKLEKSFNVLKRQNKQSVSDDDIISKFLRNMT